MNEIVEIPTQYAYRLINNGTTVIITSFDGESHNGCTVAWITNLQKDPSMFIAVIGKRHKTFENIKLTKECVINIPTIDQKDLIMKLGTESGHKKDKMSGLSTIESKYIKPLRIDGSSAWIEARFIDQPTEVEYSAWIFKTLGAFALKDAISENYEFNIKKYPTLHHLGGSAFGICKEKY